MLGANQDAAVSPHGHAQQSPPSVDACPFAHLHLATALAVVTQDHVEAHTCRSSLAAGPSRSFGHLDLSLGLYPCLYHAGHHACRIGRPAAYHEHHYAHLVGDGIHRRAGDRATSLYSRLDRRVRPTGADR